MFQPQSTPFATSFYGVGVPPSAPSQAGYDGLSLDPPNGVGRRDDLAPAFGFTPSSVAGTLRIPGGLSSSSRGGTAVAQAEFVDGGAGDFLANSGVKSAGRRSTRSGHGLLEGTDNNGGQGQPQQHLLYSSASPIALAHRRGAAAGPPSRAAAQTTHQHGQVQGQGPGQGQGQAHSSSQQPHHQLVTQVQTHAHHAAHSRQQQRNQHLSHATSSSPNHHPSPPSHTLPPHHHNPTAPIAHFVQPASSCNQQRVNYNTSNNYSIPSPAGSAASSSNNPNAALDDPLHSSYSATAHPSSAVSIATPAASTSSTRARSADMAGDATSDTAFQDELAAQQRAAETYQPQLEGPVIGDKRPSDVITEEYAKADPFYVEKTVNLPQTYSHFRPVQGDGNCGWRAIGFSYFEHLILAGEPEKLHHEVARLTSLNNYLATYGGYQMDLFEDMVIETINLLKELAQIASDTTAAMSLLMERFNDRNCSNAIVYHLRLLAGAWLKGNAADYEPFLDAGGDVAQWAHLNIEVPDKEIDHLSIILLSSILLKPIGFVLEIAYLDRTPGSLVNTYRFPDETNGQDPMTLGPIIYLLFRPDHYDILYKDPVEPVTPAPAPAPVSLQVNRAASFSHHHQITSHPPTSLHDFTTLDYSSLAMLPGFCGPAPGLSPLTAPSPTSPMHDAYAPSAQASWIQAPFPEPHLQQAIAPPPPSLAAGPTPAPSQPQSTPPASTSSNGPNKANQPVDYQLRFSSQCFHLKNPSVESSLLPQSPFPEPSFTTTMFKNSHFNKAHYNNPHFHPEEWTPEDETSERCTGGGVGKKKSRVKPEH